MLENLAILKLLDINKLSYLVISKQESIMAKSDALILNKKQFNALSCSSDKNELRVEGLLNSRIVHRYVVKSFDGEDFTILSIKNDFKTAKSVYNDSDTANCLSLVVSLSSGPFEVLEDLLIGDFKY
jgi:hypothetical protein